MAGLMYECLYNLKLMFEPLFNIVNGSVRRMVKCFRKYGRSHTGKRNQY